MFEASFVSKCLCKRNLRVSAWGFVRPKRSPRSFSHTPQGPLCPESAHPSVYLGQQRYHLGSLYKLFDLLLCCCGSPCCSASCCSLCIHIPPSTCRRCLFMFLQGVVIDFSLLLLWLVKKINGNYAFTFILNKIFQQAVKLHRSLYIVILNVMPAKLRQRHVYHRVTSVFLWATLSKTFFFGFHPSSLFAEIIPDCLFTHSWTSLHPEPFKDVAFICSHDSIACFQLICFILKSPEQVQGLVNVKGPLLPLSQLIWIMPWAINSE